MRTTVSLGQALARAAAVAAALVLPAMPAAAGLLLPVPATTIYPGQVIEDGMIRERDVMPVEIGRASVVPDRGGLVGMVARRTLLPDRPVPVASVAVPDLVPRGSPVDIVFAEDGLTIRAQAMALEAGAEGALVRVRNLDSGLIVTATVQPDGTVRVGDLQ